MGHFALIPSQSAHMKRNPRSSASAECHWHEACIVETPALFRPPGGLVRIGMYLSHQPDTHGGTRMQWTTPSFTDMRFGFEITMYIATR